jgi:hypothetical protein
MAVFTITKLKLALAGFIAALMLAIPLASSQPAQAVTCGWLGAGSESYRHCSTRTHVVLRVEDFWGTDYYPCVGPGVTFLGNLSRWRIVDATYIGRTC